MSALRESISLEAIQRAIRARLAVTYGAESPYVVLPLPIHAMPVSDDGLNWELIFDPETAPDEGIDAARSAAATVASNFNISTYH